MVLHLYEKINWSPRTRQCDLEHIGGFSHNYLHIVLSDEQMQKRKSLATQKCQDLSNSNVSGLS